MSYNPTTYNPAVVSNPQVTLSTSTVLTGTTNDVLYTGFGGETLTLPPATAAGAGQGQCIKVRHAGTGIIYVTANGADTIETGQSTVPIYFSSTFTFMSDGVSKWYIVVSDERANNISSGPLLKAYDDFLWSTLPVSYGTPTVSTGSIAMGTAGDLAHPGYVRLSTGGSNSGAQGLMVAALNAFVPDGGKLTFEMAIRINQLSTGGERFIIQMGYINDPSVTPIGAGGILRYTDNLNAGKWQTVGGGSTGNTSVAPVAGQWAKLRVEVADSSTVNMYINDVYVQSSSITAGAAGFGIGIIKTVGATPVTVDVDYSEILQQLNTPR